MKPEAGRGGKQMFPRVTTFERTVRTRVPEPTHQMKSLIWIITLSFAMLATTQAQQPALVPDLIIVNAAVHTMDDAQPQAEAVAIVGNRIAAVGASAELQSLAGPKTRVVDAGKKSVLPGF